MCDVGGGTTDFSLIRVSLEQEELAFERVAIGEHLLLGGDNLDLALATLIEERLGSRLSLTQRLALRRQCTAAKERLLSDATLEHVVVTILGSGRSVVGGTQTAEVTRADVLRLLADGFLPITAADEHPRRDRRPGALRELGLPYQSDPAVTRHLARFLSRAGQPGLQGRRHMQGRAVPPELEFCLHIPLRTMPPEAKFSLRMLARAIAAEGRFPAYMGLAWFDG